MASDGLLPALDYYYLLRSCFSRMAARRPPPPGRPIGARENPNPPADLFTFTDPYFSSYAYPAVVQQLPDIYDEPPSSVPAGMLLHKGFYDLLAMIPTPSPSRLIWGPPSSPPLSPQLESRPTIAGPRYENIGPASTRAVAPAIMSRKGRRISKDMVSKPTGFV